jgi:hypothetical protein
MAMWTSQFGYSELGKIAEETVFHIQGQTLHPFFPFFPMIPSGYLGILGIFIFLIFKFFTLGKALIPLPGAFYPYRKNYVKYGKSHTHCYRIKLISK